MKASFFSRFAFPLFSWGLPLHILFVAALFGVVGLSMSTTRAIAAWKEVFAALLLLLVFIRAVTQRGPRSRIHWMDIAIAALLLLATVYALAGNLWIYPNLKPAALLLGWRDAVFFVLLYYVGRGTPEVGGDPRTLKRFVIVLFLTCVVAVFERIFVTPEMLVLMGTASYFQEYLGVTAFTIGNEYGLPLNYWTMLNGQHFQRAGSVYLGSQSFAVPFLLFLPAATVWIFNRSKKPSAWLIAAYATIWIGLLLTLTRMTTFVCVIQLVLFVILTRRQIWAVSGLTLFGLVIVAALLLIPGFPTFLWHTISWQEGSSVSHMKDWTKGLSAFLDAPWGSGLGTTDQTAVRNGLEPLTADNLFLKYAVEMGAGGLALLVLILGGVATAAWKLYRRDVPEVQKNLGLVMFLSTVGIVINGATGVVFNAMTLSWLWFWLAGSLVTLVSRRPRGIAENFVEERERMVSVA